MDTHGQRVDEQAHHLLDAVELWRTAGDRGTEDDVLATGHASQQNCPGSLDDRVGGNAGPRCQTGQCRGHRFAERDLQLLRQRTEFLAGNGGSQQRRLFDAAQRLRPGIHGHTAILLNQPREVVPVAQCPRLSGNVPTHRVVAEERLEQQRHGPAVEDDVVVCHNKAVFARRDLDQRELDQRRVRHVEVRGLVLGKNPIQLAASFFAVGDCGEIQFAPRHVDVTENYLDRCTRSIDHKCGAQVRVTIDDGLCCGVEAIRVDAAGQRENHLHGVQVDGRLGHDSVEQQTRLQRSQRPDVLHRRETLLEPVEILLGQRYQRHVRRRESACADGLCVLRQRCECSDPQVGQGLHLGGAQQSVREGKRRFEHRAVRAVVDDGIDVDNLVGRHVRVFRRSDIGEVACRNPSEALRCSRNILRHNATQVVEADLPAAQLRQLGAGVVVDVPQQSVADTLVGSGEQLLLDCLDRRSRSNSGVEGVVDVDTGKVEGDGEGRREPADRAREIGTRDDALFAAVALELEQCRFGVDAPVTPPAHQCQS